jgi:CheY-like chemotaxis protein
LNDTNNDVTEEPIGKNKRGLIVEDNNRLRSQTVRLFSSLGFTVSDVSSVSDANNILKTQAHEIDLLMSDIVMPGGSGFDLVKFIKTEHPNVAIPLATGMVDADILEKDSYPYLDGVLTRYKSYSRSGLEKSLHKLFKE